MQYPNQHAVARPTVGGRRRLRTVVREGAPPSKAFSLIEIMVALAIVAILLALAVPVYQGYSVRAYRTQAQADLLRCAQGMERHAAQTMGYGNAVDGNGDGVGDRSTGPVSDNLCRVASSHYRISVRAADAAQFVLRAEAASGSSPVGSDGVLELDSTGERRWDRNGDGDFGDEGERSWDP